MVRRPLLIAPFLCISLLSLADATVKGSRDTDAKAPAPVLVERTAYLMGTRAHLATWSGTRDDGHRLLEAALRELELAEAELSTWQADSAISTFNHTPLGSTWHLPPSLCHTFRVIADWRRESLGAFDPAIGALTNAWDLHGQGRIASSSDIERALAASGFDSVNFDADRCSARRSRNVTIDVGAFGKGEALDRAGRTLRALGAASWMIDLGGQIAVAGVPPGELAWHVAVAHPENRATPFFSLRMSSGSLSTSGGSERDLIVNGQRVAHHLDPRTGMPAAFRGSVSVWHPSGLVADILSTALFVMGPERGIQWAEDRGLAVCFLSVQPYGRVRSAMSPTFAALAVEEPNDFAYYGRHPGSEPARVGLARAGRD